MMAKKKKVIYIVEDKRSAQFRYRVQNVQEAARNSEKWQVEYYLKAEILKVQRKLAETDLVVIERQAAKDNEVLSLIRSAQKMKIKVLFDLDDLVFDYHDLPLVMQATNSKNIFYWAGYFWGIRRIAKKVDGFLVTNDFLGKKIQKSFGKPYRVIRNSLNREQIEVADKCLPKKANQNFVIGYFSGSPTHTKDLRMVEPELLEFLDKHKDVKLRIVGYMEFSDRMKKMIDVGRIEVVKLVDYKKLQKMMAEVDVNIAPLVINDFTNCKSELKFFEAAVVETATIASPSYTFKRAIDDGVNGLLARPGEWGKKMEFLYQNSAENKKIAKQARKDVLKRYIGKEFLEEIEMAYDYFVEQK